MKKLIKQLIRHEGMRLKPYRDTVGKLTIGIGRNLDDVGISEDEAMYLLKNDIVKCYTQLMHKVPAYNSLSLPRQRVLCNMVFNLGIHRFLRFKRMLRAIEEGNYEKAAKEMLNSRWAKQVGNRASELAEIMRTGKWR